MRLNQLQTPSLILDEPKLRRNAQRMIQRAQEFGLDLRPHLKTTKSAHIGRLAIEGHSGGITVSTLREAEYFSAKGFHDITYAVCITPDKLDRVARLTEQGTKVNLITDSPWVAKAITEHSGTHSVFIEIDSGEHRTGLLPDSPELLSIARTLTRASNCVFMGVLTHGGHSYACRNADEIRRVADEERGAVVYAANLIKEVGLRCPVVSLGSTPTAVLGQSFEGATEMRPGVYLLGDMFQVGLGSCTLDDVAATVLATVISHQREHNRMVIDAGGLALSKDRSTQGRELDVNYGLVGDLESGAPVSDLCITDVHQEHGEVTSTSELPWAKFPVGTKIRVLVNHVCMTAAMYDRYYVVRGDDEVVDEWPRINGW